jgi:hypothetical protein
MGNPQCLAVLSGDAGERVVYGDSRGAAVLLLCGSRELPARDLISTDTHKVWPAARGALVCVRGGRQRAACPQPEGLCTWGCGALATALSHPGTTGG